MKKEYFSPLLEVYMTVADQTICTTSTDEPFEDGLGWDEVEEL